MSKLSIVLIDHCTNITLNSINPVSSRQCQLLDLVDWHYLCPTPPTPSADLLATRELWQGNIFWFWCATCTGWRWTSKWEWWGNMAGKNERAFVRTMTDVSESSIERGGRWCWRQKQKKGFMSLRRKDSVIIETNYLTKIKGMTQICLAMGAEVLY